MAHAVVMQVTLGGDEAEGRKMLDEMVVPQAKAQPGFLRGMWMRNEQRTGTGVIVFDTKEHAEAAEKVMRPPAGGPTVINSGVFEMQAEA